MATTINKRVEKPHPGTRKPPVKPAGKAGEKPGLLFKQEMILLAIIVAITLVAFLPTLRNGFVLWDDPEYTFENPLLKNFSFAKVFSFSTSYMGNYHPLTLLWFHWETLIFPMGNPNISGGFDPFWFHLNNLLLHLLNTVLVFCLVYELLDRKGWKAAAVTALFFGIHPMHVESVTWVSELKDVLYTAFFLGAAWCYVRYVRKKNVKYLLAAFLLFLLSCLAKGQAVTLPLLFVLFDYYLGRRYDKTAWLEKLPFFALSLFFGIIAIQSQDSGSAINRNYDLLSSLFYGCYGLLVYLWKMVLPIHLSGSYPYPVDPLKPLPGYFYLLPLILAPFVFVIFKTLKYSKDYLFGALFFVFSISVTLRFIPLGDSIVAERYTYIPYIGLFFIFGRLYARYSGMTRWNRIAPAGLVLVTLLLFLSTWQRTQVWKDSYSFWGNVAEHYPDYWRSYACMGREYNKAGDTAKALENFNKACERDKWVPPDPFMHRGVMYVNKLHDYDRAIADFKKIISFPNKKDPTQLEARQNLGLAYNKKGDFQNAIQVLDEAIAIDPSQPVSYFQKGVALTGENKLREAEEAYTQAVSLSPGYADGYFSRGVLYTDYMQLYDKGIADFRKVLELEPQNQDANFNIAICYLKKKMTKEAIESFTREINKSPDNGVLYNFRSLAYEQEDDYVRAYNDLVKAKQMGVNISGQRLNEARTKAKIPN
ncbi:MAG: tetratricopeptide repeat protein [Bacteroidota bacterium]